MGCKVCFDPNVGFHYRTSTCRACAAFFRRTINQRLRYKCYKESNCDVTYKNRFSCRFCRMKKCVAVGMVMLDDSRTSFDFHFDTANEEIDSVLPTEDDHEFYTIENVLGDSKKFLREMQHRFLNIFQRESPQSNLPFALSLCQEIAIARVNHALKWPNCTKDKMFLGGVIDFKRGMCDFYKAVEYTAEFCMEIQQFANLSLEQKLPVFKHFVERFFQMDRVFVTADFLGNNVNDTRMVAGSGQIVDFVNCPMNVAKVANMTEEQCRTLILTSERKVNNLFIAPFKRLQAHQLEIDFLIGYSMWSLEGVKGVSESTMKMCEKLRQRLADELYMHYIHEENVENYAARTYKLLNLITALDRIVEIREEDCSMSKMFQLLNVELHYDDITGR